MVGDRYTIVGPLGQGGMGVVYEAADAVTGAHVAIKLLRPSVLTVPEAVARFEREARLAAQLQSHNVARVLDVNFGAIPYIVMELLEGHDLSEELEDKPHLPIGEAVAFTLQACAAMAEAHALGIVHRDLKPSNLFLCESQGRIVVKVLDFGVSKALTETESRVTMTQASFGTPLYMSPEQVRSVKNVDARTDVWSLGVILYEMIVGRPPFEGTATATAAAIVADPIKPPHQLRGDLPLQLDAVIMKALEKDPNLRFPHVQAFAHALAPFAPTQPIPSGMRLRVPTSARKRRIEMMAGANCRPDDPTVLRGEPRAPTDGSWSSNHPAILATLATRRRKRWTAAVVLVAVTCIAAGAWFVALRGRRAEAVGANVNAASNAGAATATAPPAPTVDVDQLPHAAAATAEPAASASASGRAKPPAATSPAKTSAKGQEAGKRPSGAPAAPAATGANPPMHL